METFFTSNAPARREDVVEGEGESAADSLSRLHAFHASLQVISAGKRR